MPSLELQSTRRFSWNALYKAMKIEAQYKCESLSWYTYVAADTYRRREEDLTGPGRRGAQPLPMMAFAKIGNNPSTGL